MWHEGPKGPRESKEAHQAGGRTCLTMESMESPITSQILPKPSLIAGGPQGQVTQICTNTSLCASGKQLKEANISCHILLSEQEVQGKMAATVPSSAPPSPARSSNESTCTVAAIHSPSPDACRYRADSRQADNELIDAHTHTEL